MHRAVVVLDDVDAIEKHRLDRVLPQPGKRVVTQRPEIRVQHQYRPTALRDVCVQVTLLTPMLAAKQRMPCILRQRDGIVKSVPGLIQHRASKVGLAFSARGRGSVAHKMPAFGLNPADQGSGMRAPRRSQVAGGLDLGEDFHLKAWAVLGAGPGEARIRSAIT